MQLVLLFAGAVLFLLGLLTGVAVPAFVNPRMGLSAHLAGVQNAMFLLAIGAAWSHMQLGERLKALTGWASIVGMYLFWVALGLAAFWGTSRSTPIAGAGFQQTALKEMIVQVLLYGASLASIVGAVLLVMGFWRALIASAP
jgi:hydroxylaminobenzene mutase